MADELSAMFGDDFGREYREAFEAIDGGQSVYCEIPLVVRADLIVEAAADMTTILASLGFDEIEESHVGFGYFAATLAAAAKHALDRHLPDDPEERSIASIGLASCERMSKAWLNIFAGLQERRDALIEHEKNFPHPEE